jgi:hypothetical protein
MEQLYLLTQLQNHVPTVWFLLPALLLFMGCRQSADTATADRTSTEPVDTTAAPSQQLGYEELLALVQQTFQYFWDGAEPTSSAARERIYLNGEYPQNDQHMVSTGATGLGVVAILVGINGASSLRKKASRARS